jgi:hypothetical protein
MEHSAFGKKFNINMAEIDPHFDNDELTPEEIESLKSFKNGDSIIYKLDDGTDVEGWIYSRTAYNNEDQLRVVVMNGKDRGQQNYIRPKKFLEWQKEK